MDKEEAKKALLILTEKNNDVSEASVLCTKMNAAIVADMESPAIVIAFLLRAALDSAEYFSEKGLEHVAEGNDFTPDQDFHNQSLQSIFDGLDGEISAVLDDLIERIVNGFDALQSCRCDRCRASAAPLN